MGKQWKQAALVKRYFVSDGYRVLSGPLALGIAEPAQVSELTTPSAQVDYYEKAPAKDKKGKSKGKGKGTHAQVQ